MAYTNFKPTIWAAGIQLALERIMVGAEDCNRQYEGDVKEAGETVKILGVNAPTIRTLSGTNGTLVDPEEVQDTSVNMTIDQTAYFNYMVGDIDKAQSINGLMDALSTESSEGLANEMDKHIFAQIADENIEKYGSSATKVTKDNVLSIIDTSIQKLYENDVNPSTDIVLTVTPRFYTLFRQAYQTLDTGNSKKIENGKVGMYNGVTVKMSNNIYTTDTGATDNIMLRTKRAIAFVNPLVHTEAYRPEKKFADAVKGFVLYKAQVVRPKEVFNINVKYTD